MRSSIVHPCLVCVPAALLLLASGCSNGATSSGEASDAKADVQLDAGASSGDDGPCVPYASDADLTAPTISFASDVLPLFEKSCGASSSCHGDPTDIPERGLYLGCDTATNVTCTASSPGAQVYAQLVGAAAAKPIEETSMPYVMPGDPTQSFLMHKMDNDLCVVQGCVANNVAVSTAEMAAPWCGTYMPWIVALLPSGPVCGGTSDCTQPASFSRDTVRAWIAQGALDN